MSTIIQMLQALYGPECPNEIRFLCGDKIVAAPITEVPNGIGVKFYSDAPAGMFQFIYSVSHYVEPDAYKYEELRPTAVMSKASEDADGAVTTTIFWALKTPVAAEKLAPLMKKLGTDPAEAIPLPQEGVWELVHAQPDETYTLAELLSYFAPSDDGDDHGDDEPVVEVEAGLVPAVINARALGGWCDDGVEIVQPAKPVSQVVFFNVIGPPTYEPNSDDRLRLRRAVAVGVNARSTNWKTVEVSVAAVLWSVTDHKEGLKEGPSIVFARIDGTRRKTEFIREITYVYIDIDSGETRSHLVSEIEAQDYRANNAAFPRSQNVFESQI